MDCSSGFREISSAPPGRVTVDASGEPSPLLIVRSSSMLPSGLCIFRTPPRLLRNSPASSSPSTLVVYAATTPGSPSRARTHCPAVNCTRTNLQLIASRKAPAVRHSPPCARGKPCPLLRPAAWWKLITTPSRTVRPCARRKKTTCSLVTAEPGSAPPPSTPHLQPAARRLGHGPRTHVD